MTKQPKQLISIRIDAEVLQEILIQAKTEDRTPSYIANRMLLNSLKPKK